MAFEDVFGAPSSPSLFDDEFTGTTLDTVKWTAFNTVDLATSVDALAGFADGEVRIDVGTPRESWMRMQGGSNGSFNGIFQDFGGELPNGLHMTRIQSVQRGGIGSNNDSALLLGAWQSSSITGSREGVEIIIPEHDGGSTAQLLSQPQGGGSGVRDLGATGSNTMIGAFGLPYEYYALHKISSTVIYTWAWMSGGQPTSVGTLTYSGGQTLDAIGLGVANNTQDLPGNSFQHIDFYRYYADYNDVF